jgi:hypothetical protein
MAYTGVNKSTDYFNTKLYTGNGSAGNAQTGVGFQPDWVWIKNRDGAYWHQTYDAVRGASAGALYTNQTAAQDYMGGNGLASFNSDGFTVNSNDGCNGNGQDLVAWNWKAGDSNTSVSASGSGNNAINACTYRANTTAGFSIIQYTGRNGDIGNGNQTKVAHGLGVKPDRVIIKRTDSAEDWVVRGGTSPLQSDYYLKLNTSDTRIGSDYVGESQNDDATHFVVGNSDKVNYQGGTYIAYVFVNKSGYSKYGFYKGNGNAAGTFTFTGFKPTWLLIKHANGGTASGEHWNLQDVKRSTYNPSIIMLSPNEASTENSTTNNSIDFLSNGFKIRTNDGRLNNSGADYLYMAIGQSIVGTNNIPCTAR